MSLQLSTRDEALTPNTERIKGGWVLNETWLWWPYDALQPECPPVPRERGWGFIIFLKQGRGKFAERRKTDPEIKRNTELKGYVDHYLIVAHFYRQQSSPRIVTRFSFQRARYKTKGRPPSCQLPAISRVPPYPSQLGFWKQG